MNERLARAAVIARVDLAHERDFAFGQVEIRPSRREIVGEGFRETVEPRVMRVLVALARAQGEILSRDDLIESCWDGVIVGEDAINRCISQLRKAAEAAGNAFAIETVPRVGYRLKVAELAVPDALPEAQSPLGARASSPASPQAKDAARRAALPGVLAVALLVLIAAGFVLWRFWPAKPPPTPAAPVEASVAVLPFVNMSGDPKQEYFSDGFSEELINDLTNEPHLLVASRTSSFAFKGKSEDIGTIAHALDVHAIVEGSVRESGNRVRITAQLIDAGNGYHLWSADYTSNLTDILTLQDDLARAIAVQLTHRLVPAPSTPLPKIDPAVYRLYLAGLRQFHEPWPQGLRSALATFKEVTAKASDFADGFAWLSTGAVDLAANYDAAPASDLAVANAAAQKALALAPRNIRARAILGDVELATWNWRAAASDSRILRSEDPTNSITIELLRNYFISMGFPDEALAEWRRVSALEPKIYNDNVFTLSALDQDGRFQEELREAKLQLVHHPRDPMRLGVLCGSYALAGQIAEARAVDQRLRSLQTDPDSIFDFQYCQFYIDVASGNLRT